jgi:PAS domain S-box-containing protein
MCPQQNCAVTGESQAARGTIAAVEVPASRPLGEFDEDTAVRIILEGTAEATGEDFFKALVRKLAQATSTHGAWVTEYLPESRRLRALAFWHGDRFVPWESGIDGTPCEAVVEERRLVHIPDNIFELFPKSGRLRAAGGVSYLGVPLLHTDGRVLGHLAVLHTAPLPMEPRLIAVFQIFAARAAAELQRLRIEQEMRERERKLGLLVDSAMDAIVELDGDFLVTRLNPAAERLLGVAAERTSERVDFLPLLTDDSRAKLLQLAAAVDSRPEGERYLWIPGGLRLRPDTGEEVPAEASLSQYELDGGTYHTIILRNVRDRIEAERRIDSLRGETEYLQQELRELQNFGEILGKSPALMEALQDIDRVAAADTAVLILGETGTGKERLARAIHAASPRRGKPLIKVNCAAIPATLIESELFGHERGAFTGATARRDGRFALADGGTIFLDEVGELPLELQPKLLRVLQEGEFEPVGGTATRRVDVRVVSATNRDLDQMVRAGTFREDLYYRLNVFPIRVPPLRVRGDDIVLLAEAFVAQAARKTGRPVTLSEDDCRRLCAYDWPGNIRELQNVVERAVLTSRDGRLNLDRALPESTSRRRPEPAPAARAVRTARELEEAERENLLQALEVTGWKVAGADGAAALLGLNPSTLNSRMKALQIRRGPRRSSPMPPPGHIQ